MRRIAVVCSAVIGVALLMSPAFAQEKAKIEDIYKQTLDAAGANQVNVRTYDVPPGWATPSTGSG